MNNNNGNHGMKRRLPQDPRQRMNQHQNRFPPAHQQSPPQQQQQQQGGGPRMHGGGGGRFQGGGRGLGPGGPSFGRGPGGGGGGGRGFHTNHPQGRGNGPPHNMHQPPQQMMGGFGSHGGGRGMNGRGHNNSNNNMPGQGGGPPMGMQPGRGPMDGRNQDWNRQNQTMMSPHGHHQQQQQQQHHQQQQQQPHLMMGQGGPPLPPHGVQHQQQQMQMGSYPSPGNMHMNHSNQMNQAPLPPQNGMGFGQQQHHQQQQHQGMGGTMPPGRQVYPLPPNQQQQQPFHQQQPYQQQQQHHNQMQNFAGPTPQQGSIMPQLGQVQQQQQRQQQPYGAPPNQNRYGANTTGPPQMQLQATTPGIPTCPNMPQQQQPPNSLMPAATSSATSPKNVSTPYTQEQIDQAWTEHTNNGVKYYHNSVSQSSTYEKPKALLPEAQQQGKTSTAEAAKRAWTEYADAKTGKIYYSDGVTTTWETPADYVSTDAIMAKSIEVNAVAASAGSSGPPQKKKRKNNDQETQEPFQNSDEALASFKGLLLAKGVSPANKWNDVVKICSSGSRWDEYEAVLTTGERKQALAEYQTRRANELRTQERQERSRAKDAYLHLLAEVIPKQPAFSTTLSVRFADVRDSIAKDDRFHAVTEEKTREGLFLDFMEELRKHDERKKRSKKREAQDFFCAFLKEKAEAEDLPFSSTWNSFISSLSDLEKDDSRIKASPPVLLESDRQLYFADFMVELQAAEDEKRQKNRDTRRQDEKVQRDAYRDALEKLAAEGEIAPSSHWRDVERLIKPDSSFAPVYEQDRDAPRDIFEEFSEEWDDIYRRDRPILNQLVHPSSSREILVTVDTNYDTFVKGLLEEASSSPKLQADARRVTKAHEVLSSARLYFNELIKRAKEKQAGPLRRRGHASRRASLNGDSSSEDEGEIKEDGEVEDESEKKQDDASAIDDAPTNAATATPATNDEGQSPAAAEEG